MTKKEALRVLKINYDIKYDYVSGPVNFMTIITDQKAAVEAEMTAGTYAVTQTQIDEAFNFLQTEYNRKVTGARTTGSGSSILKGVAVGTAVVILTGALVGAAAFGIKHLPKSWGNPDKPGYTQGTESTEPVEKVEEDFTDEVSYMGDLTDSKAVETRAEEILEQFTQNGIVHTDTNTPYTKDEIITILHYMNGGLLQKGITPEAANTAYLNMIADMFNTDIVLYNSAYMIGAQIIDFDGNGNILDFEGNIVDINHIGFDQSTGLTIIDSQYAHLYSAKGLGTSEEHYRRAVEKYVPLDVTDFQFGDSTIYPYLEWFSNNYNIMMTTMDKNEKVAIFNGLTQSLVDIVYGNGYQLKLADGETLLVRYTDLSDYDDVNDYNALRIVVSLYQGARSIVDETQFELGQTENLVQTQDTYSFINNGGKATVDIEDVLDVFNAACATEDVEMNVIDSNGVIVDGDNLDLRAYSNTIHLLEENAKNGDLSVWEDHYSLSK